MGERARETRTNLLILLAKATFQMFSEGESSSIGG